MSLSERKVIAIFKTFIEKVFVPQLPKMELPCQKEWAKFSSMLSADQFNYGEMQLYVDTLPTTNADKPRNESPFFIKSKKEISVPSEQAGFASKTFGGERARLMFPLKDL